MDWSVSDECDLDCVYFWECGDDEKSVLLVILGL